MGDDDEDDESEIGAPTDPGPGAHVDYMKLVREAGDEIDGLACFDWCENWGASSCWTHAGLCGGCQFCPVESTEVHSSAEQHCRPFVTADGSMLQLDGQELFLNGVNLAWIEWGRDFLQSGNDGAGFYCGVEKAMRALRSNGGNALRVWLFTEPKDHLVWSEEGFVDGIAPGVVLMTQTLLELAAHYEILVVLVLFNGAVVRGHQSCSMFEDKEVLASLITNVVRPLAMALQGYEHLAMWEVINEPEGILDTSQSKASLGLDVCSAIHYPAVICPHADDYSGWSKGCRFDINTLQQFVNRIAGALHRWDPNHLVTVGSWHFCAQSSVAAYGSQNLFSAECLRRAGGDRDGIIDVWQFHSYPKEKGGTAFHPGAPVHTEASAYKLNGPILVGETSSRWVGTQ